MPNHIGCGGAQEAKVTTSVLAEDGERQRRGLLERNCGNRIRVDDKLDILIRVLKVEALAGHCHWSYGSRRGVSAPRSDAEDAASQLIHPHRRVWLSGKEITPPSLSQPSIQIAVCYAGIG